MVNVNVSLSSYTPFVFKSSAGNPENRKLWEHLPTSWNTQGRFTFVKNLNQIIHTVWKILVSYQQLFIYFHCLNIRNSNSKKRDLLICKTLQNRILTWIYSSPKKRSLAPVLHILGVFEKNITNPLSRIVFSFPVYWYYASFYQLGELKVGGQQPKPHYIRNELHHPWGSLSSHTSSIESDLDVLSKGSRNAL